MSFTDKELIDLVNGFTKLAERVSEMRGQMDAQQIVISHLAAGVTDEARTEAHVALSLASKAAAEKDPTYRRGFEEGMALYRRANPGQR
ncbi:MAG: hypothetical protein GAK28_00158 [Luteibacter sp.]|uniref:hypothetical protein n=1 Tax=Luteibacter sp. TaxID=1886636 RepID=UPI0013865731|nr:hypothetical protein [Luteibacter sp.]KAF1009520.1 MAG: hypothetical protein GAK28_00158 [Luteibacter sp.]